MLSKYLLLSCAHNPDKSQFQLAFLQKKEKSFEILIENDRRRAGKLKEADKICPLANNTKTVGRGGVEPFIQKFIVLFFALQTIVSVLEKSQIFLMDTN